MTYNPPIHHRRSIRLPGYDYAQAGAYFVTICTAQRECLFGEISDSVMIASRFGEIAHEEWFRSGEIRGEIALYEAEFVVMPNHVHGIVRIVCAVGATGRSPQQEQRPGPSPRSLGAMLAGYKASVTKRINQARGTPGSLVWQRNYWEHVIRNEADLSRIRQYIADNPARWSSDQLHPGAGPDRPNRS